MTFWQKTWNFGKITAFDENHGFRDYLLSLVLDQIIIRSNSALDETLVLVKLDVAHCDNSK